MATRSDLYGCLEGAVFDIRDHRPPKLLLKIDIWSNDGPDGKINAMAFTYGYGDKPHENTVQIGPVGNEDGIKHEISIQTGEYLTVLSGYTCPCITALSFSTTATGEHGPFGKCPNTGDTYFSFDAKHDSIVAFFGRHDDQIRAIGAYSGPRA